MLTLNGIKSLGAPADLVAVAVPGSGPQLSLGTLPAQPDGPYTMSASVPPGNYTVQVTSGVTLQTETTSSCTVPASSLTATGCNTLGFPASIVVTVTPSGSAAPITIVTLTSQPIGPYELTVDVPPGEYVVNTEVVATVSSQEKSSATVPPQVLTVTGNNTLGVPANIVVTARLSGSTAPITIGTLISQPVGPFSLSAEVASGTYTVDIAMTTPTLLSETQSAASVAQSAMTVTGSNTLGIPANVVVTATPSAGGQPIPIGTLTKQPAGAFSVSAEVPPGEYSVEIDLSATLSSDASSSVTVAPSLLTATGNNTLGVPADVVVIATPAGGGSPITVATCVGQPTGPYSVSVEVPAGDYMIDMTASASPSAAVSSVATVPAPDIVVTLAYKGSNYTFEKSKGTNLGDYTDPQGRFVQDCVMVTNSGLPAFRVLFRSDKQPGASRDEVVFELGDLFTNPTPFNMTTYTVVIAKAGATLATISVPQHFFRSRWRWQSAVRPVTANIANLMACGLLPHYDETITRGFTAASRTFSYTPMTLAGIYPNMSLTGEREDIGPVTEYQADYICNGRPSALSTLRAQLEGAGTIPWHLRDERTGGPLDVNAYLKATMYSANGAVPLIPYASATGISPDTAHEPALAYVPFVLTGDPYALEELQFAVTWNIVKAPCNARAWFNNDGGLRAYVWSLRSLAQAATVTPAVVPAWLKPQSYFQAILTANRAYAMTFVNNASAQCSVFQSFDSGFGSANDGNLPAGTYFSPYMEDFAAFVLGWVVAMGHADWAPVHAWKIKSTIARTNGTSGWKRANLSPYHLPIRSTITTPWVTDWGAAWALGVAKSAWADVVDANTMPTGDLSYPAYALGALAMAARLGVAEAMPCHDWLAAQFVRVLAFNHTIYRKWSIA